MTNISNPDILYKNRYRVPSARLAGYDYGSDGAYFVTICTRDRMHFFGDIVDGDIRLSEIGEIADNCWQQIPDHFPFVRLDGFVIMPNHVHGIVVIDQGVSVETQNLASLQGNLPWTRFGPQSRNLASIIRGFKIGVTKYARNNTSIFEVWQPRFHDHIIRDDDEYERISAYIRDNPKNWTTDSLFSPS